MPELTREEKLKLVEKLSQKLQDFLYSEDTGAFLLYLGQKYNLSDEKVSLLSKLTGDVILGIVPITSLSQEINSKIISEPQAATTLAQELNTELLAPAMMPASSAPATPMPIPAPSDKYRELTIAGPEVVDLRKTPPPVFTPKPVTPVKPASPAPAPAPAIPAQPIPPTLIPTPPAPTIPLIEAEPHKTPTPAPTPPVSGPRPQYIMRPSGAPPTDRPENVLDLRKDKGEF